MNYSRPYVDTPTPDEVKSLAADFNIHLSDEESELYADLASNMLSDHERLEELSEPSMGLKYTDRDPGYRPSEKEDPYNVYITKCHVNGAEEGQLAGYDIGIKDNAAVAGVEMTCGSRVLEGYIPQTDATIVQRLLDAGGTITGKLSMEDMAYSGSGELCATGPVLNPRDPEYLAGGSSSGSAAAVAAGEVDVAIGTDQGGSVRMPASFCGCVGHKPTYGLVPYTGGVGVGHTLDHFGPIASTVEDCAKVLDVTAGHDPLDPRQHPVEVGDYYEATSEEAADLSIGVVKEGFGFENSEEGVDKTVRDALDEFSSSVSTVTDISVPLHRDGEVIWGGIVHEAAAALIRDEGVGHYLDGFYDTQFARSFGTLRRQRADDFPPSLKSALIVGAYLSERYYGYYHAKAQNLRRPLRDAYNETLSEKDVLAMPTTLTTALEKQDNLSQGDLVARGATLHVTNTAPFNVTGHPAITVPCGTVDGLPVGLMFVAQHGDDETLFTVAAEFERSVGWDL